MAFQIQVGFGAAVVMGRSVVSVFVAAAQHVLKGAARVEPHFQNIRALGVLLGVVTRLVQDVFHRGTAPRLDAALFHHIRRLIQDVHGAGMQFATVFVQKERHRHPP